MNNFSITNLKSPENDNDAVHKKYLMEQLNSIEVNNEHLNERIGDVKRFFKRQLNNKDFNDDTKLQQEVTSLKSFIEEQLVNVSNKTELISLISTLEDNIAKQKLDIQQLIDNILGENEETFQQELNDLETKLNSELLTNIQQQIQNIDDSVIKQQITTINNLVLKQDKNILALEKKFLKKESYYFNLPFRYLRRDDASITDNIDASTEIDYKKF
ncbi:hypothetical protein LOTGIDRAFT_175238 [Lottia gigantea]|uniref:Uncharacterized protein n=1 Tax=Lottia gigantea TaxID=225164 RepID=V4AKC2_LOTGI|nr:hypothetical protein LOTGIDRAFT_175238 [Lottia gigantea]ESO95185.1 hypothetical protein LOTGIDRAFT_175238 [Lottia gigantea]